MGKAAPNPSQQRQPPTVPPHNLQHKSARVTRGSGINVVDGLADPVQRGRCADGEVRHGHVVVDGANEANNFEMGVRCCLSLGYFRWGGESEIKI